MLSFRPSCIVLFFVVVYDIVCRANASDYRLVRSLKSLQYQNILPRKLRYVLDIGAFSGEWTDFMKGEYCFPEASYIMFEGNKDKESVLKTIDADYVIGLIGDIDGKIVSYHVAGESDSPGVSTGNSIFLENTPHFSQSNFEIRHQRMTTVDVIIDQKEKEERQAVCLLEIDNLEELDECVSRQNASQIWVDVIKFDIQGAELLGLTGAKQTIEKFQPVIVMESSIVPYNMGSPSFVDVHIFMDSIDYFMVDIVEKHPGCNANVDGCILLQLDCVWVAKSRMNYGDVLADSPEVIISHGGIVSNDLSVEDIQFEYKWDCKSDRGL